jgi:dTDP-4-amino-4,6-dideoxygalactose transaminase
MIKLSSASVGAAEKEAACRVLDSQVLNMGSEVHAFEKELKEFFGKDFLEVICVHSCTAALQISVWAKGVSPCDEVLVPSYTFISSFQAVSALGAIPIPTDVDTDDGFMNVDDMYRRITKKTKAIMPVLFAGCGGDKIQKIYDIAHERKIAVIEDAAHSFGDETIANRAGTLCFSFDPIKNITCSDGGCILTNDDELYEKAKDARLLGVIGDTEARFQGKRSWDCDTTHQGWRLHMNNICAAIGRAQLSRFNSELGKARKEYSNMYIEKLRDIDDIVLFPLNTRTAVPHIFPIIVKNNKRDALKSFLLEKGIETGIQYKPNHLLTKFNAGYSLPNAEWLYRNMLSIPLHPRLSLDDTSYVVEKISEFFGEKRNP